MEREFGGFWRRGIAFLIDGFIITFIWCILFCVGSVALWLGFPAQHKGLLSVGILELGVKFIFFYTLAAVSAHMLYFIYFHEASGQTPGKMLLGVRVIQATGEEMTFGISFLRWAGYLISFVFWGIGFLWVMFDREKQGWHDKIAGTVVIRTRNADQAPQEPIDEKYLDKDREIL
jgi:uncharacterized RDD family membrane protein YckC